MAARPDRLAVLAGRLDAARADLEPIRTGLAEAWNREDAADAERWRALLAQAEDRAEAAYGKWHAEWIQRGRPLSPLRGGRRRNPARNRRFIQEAIHRPGALEAKAKRAGMSVDAFARKHQHDSGPRGSAALRTGNQARFYLNVLRPAAMARASNAPYDEDAMRFLINPPNRRRRMARRTPARDRKGRFIRKNRSASRKRKASRRTTTARKRTTRARSTPRRSTRRRAARRNPPAPDFVRMFMDGAVEAAEIIVGKTGARVVPGFLNLPRTGNVGLAVQAAVAVGLGYVASIVAGPNVGAAVLAGGLTAPLEDLAVRYNIPVVGPALAIPAGGGTTGMYAPALRARSDAGALKGWVTTPPGSGINPNAVYYQA